MGDVWEDYKSLPEVQFFVHHWPFLLLVLVNWAIALVLVRRVTKRD